MRIKFLTVAMILALSFAGVTDGQIPGGSSAREIPAEIKISDARVDQIIERANDHFRWGKLNLEDNKREQARDEFDKAIDEILMSGLDVRANERLKICYLELVEKIYREEVPLIRSASQQDAKSASQNQIGFRQQPLRPSSLNPPSKSVSTENATSNAEQKPCTLGIEKAPAIRGIRLGMTVSEVRAIHPTISKSNTSDTVDIAMKYSAASSTPDKNLKGISSLSLYFFRERLWMMIVYYEQNNAQEIEPILTALSLPKKDRSRAVCRGFKADLDELELLHDLKWHLSLWDSAAEEKIRALEIKKGNTQCERPLVIRGVKLGMTSTQFKTLYPQARIVSKRTEVGELVFRSLAGDDARLKGIGTLWTYFLDGKVYFLVVDYSSQIEWKSLDQFVEQFSKTTGLQKKWDGVLGDRTLRCNDFTVQAKWIADHPRVLISDRSEVLKLTKREERSKSPSSFRP